MRLGLAVLGLVLAACSLPRGAALESEILKSAEIDRNEFALYRVDRTLLPQVADWPMTGTAPRSDGWIRRSRGPSDQIIRGGDRLNLSVWDANDGSLLAAPGQRMVEVKAVEVSPDGTVFVPYLDRIHVSGQTPDEARAAIQVELEKVLPSAQVQLSMVTGRRNSVDLVGGVGAAGTYPLPDRDFTVLGLISQGGGVAASMRNPQVRLMRGSKVYAMSLARLYEDPALDTTLRGGDKVIVDEDKRFFMALGAAGAEKVVYFETDRMSALEAVTLMGGVADDRANLQGILILREYPDRAVRSDGRGPSQTRTVFVIDMTSADGLFSAGQFRIHPNDVVLVTESPVTSTQTVFSLIGRAFGISSNL